MIKFREFIESEGEKITEEFERNQDKAKIDSVQYPDIHTLTNFLKKYLRALPIPIIGFEQYEEMVTTFRDLKHLTVEEKVGSFAFSLFYNSFFKIASFKCKRNFCSQKS